jgi:hypothetical protein
MYGEDDDNDNDVAVNVNDGWIYWLLYIIYEESLCMVPFLVLFMSFFLLTFLVSWDVFHILYALYC